MRTIGLMSGTSLDGVDGVLADFTSDGRLQVLAFCSHDMPSDLRTELLALNTPGDNELHRAALAANALTRVYAEVVHDLRSRSGVNAGSIDAIGAHGQTVRHRPGEFDGTGYTLQLNNPALLAELTGITVVADFRSRDVAAGGQGAPLVPAFHRLLLGAEPEPSAFLNIGGIANLTLLGGVASTPVLGFDCGPGNVLMDYWCQRHTGNPFDHQGNWGRIGVVHAGLLRALLDESFFHQAPPKSTGRDLFNPAWLEQKLHGLGAIAPVDVQASLCALTAQSCAQAIMAHHPNCRRVLVCGGGAFNAALMEQLQNFITGCRIETTDAVGLPPMQVEASAFAWLAYRTMERKAGNMPEVTGASGPRILGATFYA